MMNKRETLEPLLTVREVADRLRVARGTVYTWAYRRLIPAQKVGGRLRFSPRALRRWLRSGLRRAQGEVKP